MNILVINGPNLNMLGVREPKIYGMQTHADLEVLIKKHCETWGVTVRVFQSNHEGAIVDEIQKAYGVADAIVINPAAYTHTSVAILDALKAVSIPAVEVHLSRVYEREEFRQISYTSRFCERIITGHGFKGYLMAIDYILETYGKKEEAWI